VSDRDSPRGEETYRPTLGDGVRACVVSKERVVDVSDDIDTRRRRARVHRRDEDVANEGRLQLVPVTQTSTCNARIELRKAKVPDKVDGVFLSFVSSEAVTKDIEKLTGCVVNKTTSKSAKIAVMIPVWTVTGGDDYQHETRREG
jgi:hypothetical protein